MFDGKMLRELAGIPIRRIDLANSELALAEPDPLTLANLTTKSLTLWIAAISRFDCIAIGSEPESDRRLFVTPAKAGAQGPRRGAGLPWVPAFEAVRKLTTGRIGAGASFETAASRLPQDEVFS